MQTPGYLFRRCSRRHSAMRRSSLSCIITCNSIVLRIVLDQLHKQRFVKHFTIRRCTQLTVIRHAMCQYECRRSHFILYLSKLLCRRRRWTEVVSSVSLSVAFNWPPVFTTVPAVSPVQSLDGAN